MDVGKNAESCRTTNTRFVFFVDFTELQCWLLWRIRGNSMYYMHCRVPVPLCWYDSSDSVSEWDLLQQRTVSVHTVCTGVVFGQGSSCLYSLHALYGW